MKKLTPNQVCELARAFPGVTEKDHFGSDAFIAKGRIFVTVWHDKGIANLMVPRDVQRGFLERDGGDAFRTIDNAWGDYAFSAVLGEIEPGLLQEALAAAFEHSGVKRKPLKSTKKKAPPKRKPTTRKKS
jgi:hypothetical protein